MEYKGLYLVAPHGRLVYDGIKTAIIKPRPEPVLTGHWIIVSKEDGTGWAFGEADIGAPTELSAYAFKDYQHIHQVDETDRLRWWQNTEPLLMYPITKFTPYEEPMQVEVPPGTQTVMEEVKEAVKEEEPMDEKAAMPFAPRTRSWDRDAADGRIRSWADAKDKPNAKYGRGFMWVDKAHPELFGSYKFPFIDIIGGEPHIVPKALSAILGRLPGSNIPESAKGAIRARVESLQKRLGKKAEEDTCPECGAEVPLDEPECPACGAQMERALVATTATQLGQQIKESTEEPQLDIKTDTEYTIKAGRRIRQEKLTLLQQIVKKGEEVVNDLKGLIGWATGKEESVPIVEFLSGGKDVAHHGAAFALKAKDGRPWWFQWTTNAFRDRESEIFTTKSIEDYVDRHSSDDIKGEFWFWHIPGSKFADVRWQALIGRFLVQTGPFDDTTIGQAFKDFLVQHPDGYPDFAPNGWGTSHGYRYDARDREDGVYEQFEIKESTVLPWSKAANQFAPAPRIIQEVKEMNEEQRNALHGIFGEELTKTIEEEGEKLTKELEEEGVDFKETEETVVETEVETQVETEVTTEAEKAEEVEPTPEPAVLTQEDFLEGLKYAVDTLRDEFAKAVSDLDEKISTVSTSVQKAQEEEHKQVMEQIQSTPAASMTEMVASTIGSLQTKVEDKEVKEMGAPEEKDPKDTQNRFFFEQCPHIPSQ